MIDFDHIIGFEWDAGNDRKSTLKNAVTNAEAEEDRIAEDELGEGGRG